jgi:Winged helix DNA-binding domain
VAADVLSDRALGRATLARQHLLERTALDPAAAVEQLVGLQAQEPLDPYLALWSRLEPFDPFELGSRLEDRSLVRIVVMRGTIHLVTAGDALLLRPLMQPVLEAELSRHSEFAPHLKGVDIAPALAFGHDLLARQPRSTRALRTAMAERFPGLHAAALAYACRCLLPLVQVPPRGVWGRTLQVTLAPLDTWVGEPVVDRPVLDDVVLRYLAAFGPAAVADVATWSRLTGLRAVVERIRPKLRSFHDERGRELLDLPDAPRPDADTPAPVRVLPEYDNVLLSHADRSRFGRDEDRKVLGAAGPYKGAVLVDGQVRAVWHFEGSTMVVEHVRLPRRARTELEAEAGRAVHFLRPDAPDADVRVVAVG